MRTRQGAAIPLVRSIRPERGGRHDAAQAPAGSALPGDALKPPLVAASLRLLHRAAAASRHHPHG